MKSFESYRLMDRQTYRMDRNYKSGRFAGGQLRAEKQKANNVHRTLRMLPTYLVVAELYCPHGHNHRK